MNSVMSDVILPFDGIQIGQLSLITVTHRLFGKKIIIIEFKVN